MAPGDVCHGPRCSLAGLGPAALEYRSCHWSGGSAGSPQCVRPMGCWFFPVPRPPYVCAVSWASRLLFTGVPARCVVSGVPRPGPPGSCSPVCPLGVVCCVCGVRGLPAPVHRCARSVCCVACAVSWASRLLFTGVPAPCVVLRVRRPEPPGSCSPVCPLGVLCCVCGVLGLPAPVHRCARSLCCVACAVSWASRLLFTGVPARCGVLRVRCPGPPGSCSPVCPLGVLRCVCGVLGLPAPVHRCARSVCCFACAVSWASRLLFTGAPARCVVLRVRCPGPPGSCSPVRPLGVLCCVCGVLGLPAPVHRCARSVCCVGCAVSWVSSLLFTGVPAQCVVLRVRCPGPPGSCSPVRPLGVLCCVCGVLGLPAFVHRCARSVCRVGCAVSWASWLLFTGVPARCVVLRVRCPGPPGSCSPVRPLGVLCCVCGVLGLLAPVHLCARSVCCVACAASWASWLLFTDVPARCVVLRVPRPGPPGSCSPVCPLGVLCCVCGAWASWLLFTRVPARCVVLRVRCPGPPGSCSPVCPLGVLRCLCGVLGLPAPVHRCARSLCFFFFFFFFACAVSWASRLLFTGAPARCVVFRVRRPGPPGSCSPVCPLGVLCCVCGVLGLLAPFHRCARSVCCVACAASWASWLLFTGVPARCVVLRVRCPGPPGSCSPVRPLGVLCCVCGVLGLLAPVHRCARSVCCVACAASWASWLLFTGVPARCVVLCVRRPGPPGSCSPVCPLGVLCCVCGVLGLPAPVHRCVRSVCCVACAVSWASRLLFTGVPARCVFFFFFFACAVSLASLLLFTGAPARCVVLRVRRPGPPGSCSPVCPLRVLCCVCGVLGLLAPVHRCARSVWCVACAVSWASRLLFTGAPARCVVLRVRCPGPPGSCSPVCPLGVSCWVCCVLGLLASVHRCARSVCCVACAVSWASRLLFTGAPARCVVLRVRCPGPPGSCSPVRPLGVLCCVCGVLGLLAPVHRCARSVCCVACAVPGPPGSCSPVCPLGVLRCVCGVLGLLAPVHRCARSVCCVACAASWASWLLFTGVPARCVVLRVRCPGPPGSCSPVRPLGVLCCVCGVLGLLAPVHRCARSVCCVACAASWASWLLFTGVPARCVVLRVRRPGPPGSCSPVCPLGVWCCVCGVLGLLAPVHRCARSVCCVACAASWASWLLFTGVPARCVVLRVRRPGPPGSCSPVCPLGVLCCVCDVLGLLAPVHRCARSVCCVAVRGVAAGRSHVHPDGGWRSRQGLGTLRAHTRPSGRRLFVAGRGWVPSGRALVHPDGGWRACACSLWPGRAGWPPGRVVVRLTFSFGRFVFLLCSAPSGLGLPPSLPLPLPFLVVLALCFGCFSRPPAAWLFVRSRLVCVSRLAVGCSVVVPPPPPLPFCVSRFLALLLGALVVFFFFFLLPLCAPVVSGFLWFPAPGALGLGAVRCLLCWPSASRLSVRLSLFRAFRLAGGCSLSVAAPPPLFVSRFSSLPLGAVVCFVVLCVPGCGAAPRCCALCPPVLCCPLLCCARWVPLLVAPCPVALPVALGPCALRRCVLRCSPVLCVFCRGAVVRAVVRRSALCCVCPGVLCCAFPVLSALCGAVLRCAGALALCCSCGACCCWCLVLWCAVVRCWVWWPVVVCWWRVSVSVSLSGRVVCCPVVGVVWCGALLSCVVFCGAVLLRGVVLLCSAVVLRCCWGLLYPPVGCRAVLCCAVGWLCCFLPGGGVCVLWCSFPRAVRSLSSPLCALRCLVVLAVVPCFPVSCAVALCCRVVLCCRALLSFCGAACVCFALLRPVVRRLCRLRCCWCLVLWRDMAVTSSPHALPPQHIRDPKQRVHTDVWVLGPTKVPLACMPCGGSVPWGWWGAVPGGAGPPSL